MKPYMTSPIRHTDQVFVMGIGEEFEGEGPVECAGRLITLKPGKGLENRLWAAVNRLLRDVQFADPDTILDFDGLEGLRDSVESYGLAKQKEARKLGLDEALALLTSDKRASKDEFVKQVVTLKANRKKASSRLLALEMSSGLSEADGDDFLEAVFEQTKLDDLIFCGGLDMMGAGAYGEHSGFVVYRRMRKSERKGCKDHFSRQDIPEPLPEKQSPLNENAIAIIDHIRISRDKIREFAKLLKETGWPLDAPLVTQWTDSKYDPYFTSTILEVCVIEDHPAQIKYLVEKRDAAASLPKKKATRLFGIAVANGSSRCARFVLDHFPPVLSEDGAQLLYDACYRNIEWVVRWLVEEGVPPVSGDPKTEPMKGAIQSAWSRYGLLRCIDLDTVAYLVEAGADINVGDKGGQEHMWLRGRATAKEQARLKALGADLSLWDKTAR